MTNADDDILQTLALAVRRGTTLAWCVERAPSGADPLPAAWNAAWSALARCEVVAAVHGEDAGARARHAYQDAYMLSHDGGGSWTEAHVAGRAAILALYPTLTLAEVLRAVDGSRGTEA